VAWGLPALQRKQQRPRIRFPRAGGIWRPMRILSVACLVPPASRTHAFQNRGQRLSPRSKSRPRDVNDQQR